MLINELYLPELKTRFILNIIIDTSKRSQNKLWHDFIKQK